MYTWRRTNVDLLWYCWNEQSLFSIETVRAPRRPKGRPVINYYVVCTGPGKCATYEVNSNARAVLANIKRRIPATINRYKCELCGDSIPIGFDGTWCVHDNCDGAQNGKSAPILDAPQSVNPANGSDPTGSPTLTHSFPVGDPSCAAGGMQGRSQDDDAPERKIKIWESSTLRGDWTWPVSDLEKDVFLGMLFRSMFGVWPWAYERLDDPILDREEWRRMWLRTAADFSRIYGGKELQIYIETIQGKGR